VHHPARIRVVRNEIRIAAVAVSVALALPATTVAKDEYWLKLCGETGCKLVTDRIVAAALSQETDDFGVVAPARVTSPFFTVQYVPAGRAPIAPTYRLPAAAIARTQATSEPRVAEVFAKATEGVEPFSTPRHSSFHWWPVAAAVSIGLVAVGAWHRLANSRHA
jgi:hypothetical protein